MQENTLNYFHHKIVVTIFSHQKETLFDKKTKDIYIAGKCIFSMLQHFRKQVYIYIYNLQGIKKNHKEQKSHHKIIPLSHMATVSSTE